MNLALPAMILVLALLPGAVFINTYLSSRFAKRVFGLSPIGEVGQYIILSIPLNMAALWVFNKGPNSQVMKALICMLAGDNSEVAVKAIQTTLADNWWHYGWRYVVVLVGAFVLGTLARRLVWTTRLDAVFSPLAVRHQWYYRLMGRDWRRSRFAIPYVDVLVEHPEKGSRLYRGFLDEFELDDSGCIRELSLFAAERWKRSEVVTPGSGDGPGQPAKPTEPGLGETDPDKNWIPIPGNNFVVVGRTIHSINITFLVPEEPRTRGEKTRRYLRALVKAFVKQQAVPDPA